MNNQHMRLASERRSTLALAVIAASVLTMAVSLVPGDAAASENGSSDRWQGFEIAGQFSSYRYTEPRVDVEIDGQQIGARGAYRRSFGANRFFRTDARIAYGELDYRGSGVANNNPNLIFEPRVVLGREMQTGGGVVFASYAGLGYRYLYNDLRGQSSTGALGYRRYSHYFYLPIGLSAMFTTASGVQLMPTIEYDYFIRGRQYSQLADTGIAGLINSENTQRSGHGYRASFRVVHRKLFVSPWFEVWKIDDSDITQISATSFGFEPANKTREIGVDVGYRF